MSSQKPNPPQASNKKTTENQTKERKQPLNKGIPPKREH
jgi:hypothetical protein